MNVLHSIENLIIKIFLDKKLFMNFIVNTLFKMN